MVSGPCPLGPGGPPGHPATPPARPSLGGRGTTVSTILRGHKYVRKEGRSEKVDIFYLERSLAVKRRSHYA